MQNTTINKQWNTHIRFTVIVKEINHTCTSKKKEKKLIVKCQNILKVRNSYQ